MTRELHILKAPKMKSKYRCGLLCGLLQRTHVLFVSSVPMSSSTNAFLSPPVSDFEPGLDKRDAVPSFERGELVINPRVFSDESRLRLSDYTRNGSHSFDYTDTYAWPNINSFTSVFQPQELSPTSLSSEFPSYQSAHPSNASALHASRQGAVGRNFGVPYQSSLPPQVPSLRLGDVPAALYQECENVSAGRVVDGRWSSRVPAMGRSQSGLSPTFQSPAASWHPLSFSYTEVRHEMPLADECPRVSSFSATDVYPVSPVSSHPTPSQEHSAHLESPLGLENIQAPVIAAVSSGCPLGEHAPSLHQDIPLSDDIREVRAHLKHHHRFNAAGKKRARCLWVGCTEYLQRENIPRHIISKHIKAKAKCPACGKTFCRQDVKMKHIKRKKCSGPYAQLGNNTRHSLTQ